MEKSKLILVETGFGLNDPTSVLLSVPEDWDYQVMYTRYKSSVISEPPCTFVDWLKSRGAKSCEDIGVEKWPPNESVKTDFTAHKPTCAVCDGFD